MCSTARSHQGQTSDGFKGPVINNRVGGYKMVGVGQVKDVGAGWRELKP